MKNLKRLILDVVDSDRISPSDKGEFIDMIGKSIKGKSNKEYVAPIIDGARVRIYDHRSPYCGEWWKLDEDKYILTKRIARGYKAV